MDRQTFLKLLAAGVVGAAVGRSTASPLGPSPNVTAPPETSSRAARTAPVSTAVEGRSATGIVPVPPPAGVVAGLPGQGATLALTIDDGTSSDVVAAYVALATSTGIRLTFFPNGCYRSWTESAPALRPLVDAGQVALGNHTWSHPDLTTLGDREVAAEITRADKFLRNTFGVRSSPFLRPPYGAHTARVDRIAADLGHPTIALWNGTLGDDRVLSAADLLAHAQQWFQAQHIVIGHANHPAVTRILPQLMALIGERRLQTVTLDDVWSAGG
jgi:peptidoglycan/xylan/chitin deacetylase (PgdA/CDA1 family)